MKLKRIASLMEMSCLVSFWLTLWDKLLFLLLTGKSAHLWSLWFKLQTLVNINMTHDFASLKSLPKYHLTKMPLLKILYKIAYYLPIFSMIFLGSKQSKPAQVTVYFLIYYSNVFIPSLTIPEDLLRKTKVENNFIACFINFLKIWLKRKSDTQVLNSSR